MDWYVDATDAAAVSELRREIGRYLRRHADEDGDIDAADLIVSELLANVHRHARGDAWAMIEWAGPRPQLTVYDLGPGFDHDRVPPPSDDAIGGRGLYITAQLTDALEVRRRSASGTTVTARLPVQRTRPVDHAPPAHRTSRLPPLPSALPDGFGREVFLLALAVQLAMTTEERHGPDAAEALVAQVGTDIGTQMEAEYRAATGVTGPLSQDELAACLVRSKTPSTAGSTSSTSTTNASCSGTVDARSATSCGRPPRSAA